MATVLKPEPEPAPAGFKAYRRGTHRTVDPAVTLARVQPYLARMGITRIANVTGLDRIGVPVVMVCRPNSRSLAVAQGKGLTLDAAKASGVMEAIELYHAVNASRPPASIAATSGSSTARRSAPARSTSPSSRSKLIPSTALITPFSVK
jgi:ribosomal protein S12 methylthiotransferase accessory factor YcaO